MAECKHERVEWISKPAAIDAPIGSRVPCWWQCQDCGVELPEHRCLWCGSNPRENEARGYGPHATQCVHYRYDWFVRAPGDETWRANAPNLRFHRDCFALIYPPAGSQSVKGESESS